MRNVLLICLTLTLFSFTTNAEALSPVKKCSNAAFDAMEKSIVQSHGLTLEEQLKFVQALNENSSLVDQMEKILTNYCSQLNDFASKAK